MIRNTSPNIADLSARKQKLEIVYLVQLELGDDKTWNLQSASLHLIFKSLVNNLRIWSTRYHLVSILGWLCWVVGFFYCLATQLYFASICLLLVPLTRVLVFLTRGGKRRRLLNSCASSFSRLIVTTSSLNGSEWCAFYGSNYTLDSLLNKPLYRI
jgi:hypothetical protein